MSKNNKNNLSPLAKNIAHGLEDMIAKKEGRFTKKMVSYKFPVMPKQVDVKNIRKKLNMTQEQFTQFGFSISAIRHWEAHRRVPEGSARILLKIIETHPELVTEVLRPH